MSRKLKRHGRKVLNISAKTFIDDYFYRIDLDADYQREKIWSTDDQKKLLDSMLKNIDIPKMYLARVNDSEQFEFECMDGKQRMTTLLRFFKPDPDEKKPLTVRHLETEYTYKGLEEEHPTVSRILENYELSFTIYESLDEELVRLIFRRLQLGVRLNSGELLNSMTGPIRDFIYNEMKYDAPFLRFTKLKKRRFSPQFTLAQVCINSFSRAEHGGEFVRARYDDLADFFAESADTEKTEKKLDRIRKVLKQLDKAFGEDAILISSRAVAVTAYLFGEELVNEKNTDKLDEFAQFYLKLLQTIKLDMKRIAKFDKPENTLVLEEFQKYILQASVEPYSIKRRHNFVKKAFEYYLKPKTKGQIIRSK